MNEFSKVQHRSEKLEEVNVHAVCLVAWMKDFEYLHRKQLYQSAIGLIPKILGELKKYEQVNGSGRLFGIDRETVDGKGLE